MMSPLDDLKLFCMNRSLANAELRTVASALDFEIVPARSEGSDRDRTLLSPIPFLTSDGGELDGGALRDLLLP